MVEPVTRRTQANRFRLAEGMRNVWYVSVESGIGWKDIMKPEFWTHVAKSLRPGDIIEVMEESSLYYGRVLVRNVDRVSAVVQQLDFYDLTKAPMGEAAKEESYSIEWKGPIRKHAIMRGNAVVAEGFGSKEEAQKHLVTSLLPAAA